SPQDGSIIRPWSHLYKITPGQHVYAAICANCHGVRGDAQTGAAKVLRYTTGPRVASFVDGMFGPRSDPNSNLLSFDKRTSEVLPNQPPSNVVALGQDGAVKYLLWMANGGTTVSFGRTEEETEVFLKTFVSSRSISRNPLPVQNGEPSERISRGAGANMLQI